MWVLCVCVCLFVYLPFNVPVCLSAFQCVCLSICLSMCLSVCRFVSPPICLSLGMFLCLSVCPSLCLSAIPSLCHIKLHRKTHKRISYSWPLNQLKTPHWANNVLSLSHNHCTTNAIQELRGDTYKRDWILHMLQRDLWNVSFHLFVYSKMYTYMLGEILQILLYYY